MIRTTLVAGGLAMMASVGLAADVTQAKVGKKAPDFTVTGIDGKQFKLSDKTGKDKHIVLMFSRAHW